MIYPPKRLVACMLLLCSTFSPQSCEADKSNIAPAVYATREIRSGSIICAKDIEQEMVSYKILPGKSIPSALLIVGFRAANNLPARIIIMAQDVNFTAKLSPAEELIAKREISKAMKKWHSKADIRWFNSSLCDRSPSIQQQYRK